MTDEQHTEQAAPIAPTAETAEIERLKKLLKQAERKSWKPKPQSMKGAAVVAAVLGFGGYVWYLGQQPDAPDIGLPLPTAQTRDFASGSPIDGLTIANPGGQAAEVSEDEERLRQQVAALEAQLKELSEAPAQTVAAVDDAALQKLRDDLDVIKAASTTKDERITELEGALAEMDAERLRLETQLETDAFLAEQAALEADERQRQIEEDERRRQELERRRAEAEALAEAQINSPMVANFGSGGGNAQDEGKRDYEGDEAFLRAGAESAETIQSQVIAAPGNTILQGTPIEAVLENGIISSLSGTITAIVTRDVWAADMSRVLVPRGSKLVGRYDSGVDIGQKRILMAWDRLITPDFQSVQLEAYGTDRLGRSGMPGKVNNHFFQRFGSAAMISIIGAAPNIAANNTTNETASETAEAVADDFSSAVDNVVADYLSIAPTIAVDQGDIAMVLVNADIELF